MPKKRGRKKIVKPASQEAPNKTEMSVIPTPKKNTVVFVAIALGALAGAFIYRANQLSKQIKAMPGQTPVKWFK